MSSEERTKAEPCAGTFSGCLVEGGEDEKAREGKRRRRAIGISIVLQSAGLAALVIAPLFAKQAELTERIAVPIPPYSRHAAARAETQPAISRPQVRPCLSCWSRNITPIIRNSGENNPPGQKVEPGFNIGSTNPGNPDDALNMSDARPQPPGQEEPLREKRRIHESHINPALLTRRVEPVYPFLGHQLRKSGKVELHAVIATDGSIQLLEVVSGDPLFIHSALEAVRQWRYKPTNLNGQAVEIDTFITVIYTLQ